MSKPNVAFICVHNSCHSQIAETLGKHLAANVFESYSAGTEVNPQINQDAVRLMKQLYHIDLEYFIDLMTELLCDTLKKLLLYHRLANPPITFTFICDS